MIDLVSNRSLDRFQREKLESKFFSEVFENRIYRKLSKRRRAREESSLLTRRVYPHLENGVKLLEIISFVRRFHRVNGTIFRGFPFHGEEKSARTARIPVRGTPISHLRLP